MSSNLPSVSPSDSYSAMDVSNGDHPNSAVRPFIVGTIVGGVAGALVGTALSAQTRGFVVGLYQLLQRRLATSDYDRLRFELLLQ
jgi:hypothetical protein